LYLLYIIVYETLHLICTEEDPVWSKRLHFLEIKHI